MSGVRANRIFGKRRESHVLILASGAITYPKVATEFPLWEAPGVFAELAADPGKVHKAVLTRQPTDVCRP